MTLTALLAVAGLAWAYIFLGAGMSADSMGMGDMMMNPTPWTRSYFVLMMTMWAAMMVAMMLPSAAPMVLLFGTIERRRHQVAPQAATALFALAYVAVWTGFAVAATTLQWSLERLALLSPMMATTNTLLAAAILIGAGIYQLTPLKHACLRNCRSPLEFITRFWGRGPFVIGLLHGMYCLGCCWVLMLLLFVGGVMNLLWVGLIAIFVLVEKSVPRGNWIGYGAGAALILWGVWTLLAEVFQVS